MRASISEGLAALDLRKLRSNERARFDKFVVEGKGRVITAMFYCPGLR
jgi:hypothetical protein